MSERPIMILSGSLQEAMQYIKDSDLKMGQARYIPYPQKLLGVRDYELVRVGTWYERRDLGEIERIIAEHPPA